MASIRKRGKWWSYRINVGVNPLTKKRIQTTISHSSDFPGGFKTKEEAKTAATAHQYELDHGTYVKIKDILFADFAKLWFKHYCRNRKVSTIRVRKYELLRFTKYFEFDKLKDIDKNKYQEFLDYMKKEKDYDDNTVKGTNSTGVIMFEYAMEFDYIKVNPTIYAVLPKTLKTVEDIENKVEIPKYLEKDELALYLKVARYMGQKADYFIFLSLSYSGMRDGELVALKKTDFDKSAKEVSVTKTYFSESGRIEDYVLLTPKTEGSIRKTEIDSIVFDAYDEHIAIQNEYKMKHRKVYHDKGFVFANMFKFPGYPMNGAYINSRMQAILKLAKLDLNLTPHSLRHTHTSLCAEAGIPLEEIQNRLGHVDDDTTKLVYMHVTKKRKKEAAKMFGEFMRK